jgi:GDP-mannose 6-dehydrogenase
VTGVDVLDKKVEAFKSGKSPIVEPELDNLLKGGKSAGLLNATMDSAMAVDATDLSIICVGTPSLDSGGLNLEYVRGVTSQIRNALLASTKNHIIIFRSTMLPGSTRALVTNYLSELIAEGRLSVYYCPEFLREGTAVSDFRDPSLSVIGTFDGEPDVSPAMSLVGENARPMKWEDAEMIKYACNYFHALKVGFANEIGRIAKLVDVDSRSVMEAVCADTRLNISDYYMRPGNPFGGSCLPKDVKALIAHSCQAGANLPILEHVMASNEAHLRLLLQLIERSGAKKVAILGLAFKSDTDDLRSSPMVTIAETLLGRGFELKIYDRQLNLSELVGSNERMISRTMPHLADLLRSSPVEAVEDVDLVLAAHKCMTAEEIREHIGDEQQVIDINGWTELERNTKNYQGLCW